MANREMNLGAPHVGFTCGGWFLCSQRLSAERIGRDSKIQILTRNTDARGTLVPNDPCIAATVPSHRLAHSRGVKSVNQGHPSLSLRRTTLAWTAPDPTA